MSDKVQTAIYNIVEGNLDTMRSNFNKVLSEKAMNKLEEKKHEIASTYFGKKKTK